MKKSPASRSASTKYDKRQKRSNGSTPRSKPAVDTAHAREAVIQTLLGKPCWYVSCGGSAGPTFELALGEKVPREHVLGNRAHSEDFRRFEGEANLLVWCTWRLDAADRPLSSSDDTDAGIKRELTRIVGSVVEHVTVD